MKNYLFVLCCVAFLGCNINKDQNNTKTWEVYRGGPKSNAYSSLTQIDTGNVAQLEKAWTFHTGDTTSAMECNPIVVDGVMYVTSSGINVMALDAETGNLIWKFKPSQSEDWNRGVTYWEDHNDQRIYFTAGYTLYALDAETGSLITSFGSEGTVDLRKGLNRDPDKLYVRVNSPGIIYQDLIILGSSLQEGSNAAPGYVRAYNVHTGNIAWTFHTIPQPGEYGYNTWGKDAWKKAGAANVWGGMSLDKKRGWVFMGTGSAAPDFYTPGTRGKGKQLFSDTILALDAKTGKRIWHYQTVHHDLWDYDLPAPPNLVTIKKGRKSVDAVAQVTKQGFTFVLDRETGKPLFPVEERPVPKSNLEEEKSWPTQPIPSLPEPFTRQYLTEDSLTTISAKAHKYALKRFREMEYKGLYTPPGTTETIRYPSNQGGANFGGASYDPETDVLYVNANSYVITSSFSKRISSSGQGDNIVTRGQNLFDTNCASCHGRFGKPSPENFPSLVNISNKYSKSKIKNIMEAGPGRMPSFSYLTEKKKNSIIAYLTNVDKEGVIHVPDSLKKGETIDSTNTHKKGVRNRYNIDFGYKHFLDNKGYPATKPPWGTLNAINLRTGKLEWKVPLGEYKALTDQGIPSTGTQNLGGTLVTAGGLVFVGATKDEKFRAFNKKTGKLLWETSLPAGGYAMPSTYKINRKQYVVIAAGGGGTIGTKKSDAYIVFSLPK